MEGEILQAYNWHLNYNLWTMPAEAFGGHAAAEECVAERDAVSNVDDFLMCIRESNYLGHVLAEVRKKIILEGPFPLEL